MQENNQIKSKDSYWQTVRGICIIAVVLIHCRTALKIPLNTFDGMYYFFMRNLIQFPVCVFFFLSGYFIKYSGEGIFKFYRKKLPRLLIPYFVYSTIYVIISCILLKADGKQIKLTSIFIDYLTGGAAAPLYFMVAMVQYTIFAPLLIKCMDNKWRNIIVFSVSFLLLISIYISHIVFKRNIEHIIRLTFVWGIFYYIGMLIGHGKWKPVFKFKTLLVLLAVSYVLCLAETLLLMHLKMSTAFAYSQRRVSSFLFSFIVIMLLYKIKDADKRVCKPLAYLGDNSYAIFYIHWIFLMITDLLLDRFNVNLALPLINIIQLVSMLTGSLIAILLIKLILRKKLSRLFFGV